MGAKLTKNKTVSISGKSNEQSKEIITTTENTNTPVEVIANEGNKQTEKKIKEKKEQKLNKKAAKTRVDKSTNTDGCVLASSPFTEQLVGDQAATMNNGASLDISTAQVNVSYQPETSNKDVQELRNACARSGVISAESNLNNLQTSNEQDYQENNLNNASSTFVTNSDQVPSEQLQYVQS